MGNYCRNNFHQNQQCYFLPNIRLKKLGFISIRYDGQIIVENQDLILSTFYSTGNRVNKIQPYAEVNSRICRNLKSGRDYIESFEFDGTIGQLIDILQKIKEKYGDIDMVTDVNTKVRDIEIGTINVVEYYGTRVIMNLSLSESELRLSDSES